MLISLSVLPGTTTLTSSALPDKLIFLIAIPVLGIGLYIIVSRSHIYFERVFKIYDNLNEVVEENLTGMRVVKSFVREDFEEKKFTRVSEAIYKMFLKAEGIVAYNMPLMQFCIYSCMLFLCWFGARMIITSGATALTTGELTSLIAYAMTILNCLMMLSMVMVMINMARASAERIVEILDEESTLHNCDNPEDKVNDGSIQFDNVSFSYIDDKEKECLKNINLIIPSGSTLGIIGGTGSGKSSLVQLIPRLYDVTEGSVKIGGVDVRDIDIYTLRNEVAMVLQKNVLFSGTIKENLAFNTPNVSEEKIKEACKECGISEFIESLENGYDTVLNDNTSLSIGQKQLFTIARAMIQDSPMLILDEATSNVDTRTEILIQKAMDQLTSNRTSFVIAHRLSTIKNADVILVLKDGDIIEQGSHQELLAKNGVYASLYNSQFDEGNDGAIDTAMKKLAKA